MKSSRPSPLLLDCSFVSTGEYLALIKEALKKPTLTHIVTLNAEMIVEAQNNEEFRHVVQQAELKIPDGGSILWARTYLVERGNIFISLVKHFFSKEETLTGVDSVFNICTELQNVQGSAYLLGGTDKQAAGTLAVLQKKYPQLDIRVVEESLTVPSNIAALFVAYGAPKQTLWIEQNRERIQAAGIRIAIGVGGAFAMISGELPRAPYFMRRHHIEWLWRLLLEPRRIRRIWNAVVVFPTLIYNQNILYE